MALLLRFQGDDVGASSSIVAAENSYLHFVFGVCGPSLHFLTWYSSLGWRGLNVRVGHRFVCCSSWQSETPGKVEAQESTIAPSDPEKRIAECLLSYVTP